MFGLHILDISALLVYFLVVVAIGWLAKRRIANEEDYFLGGRKFGKTVSIFLAFGTGTSSDTAIAAARETYRMGMSGIWVQLFWLFVTPFYWIIAPWYRRMRVLTGGDYFQERFQSRVLTSQYVLFGLLWFMFYIAIGLVAIGKTVEIVTVKDEGQYTATERLAVEQYAEYAALQSRLGSLSEPERERFDELATLADEGTIRPFYSWLTAKYSIPVIALIVILYGVLGGLFAAAWTDTLQGILIVVLSVILLPAGLQQVGWFSGLHASTPDYLFHIVGSAATSEYTWYYVLAMILMNLVGVVVQPHIFCTGGGGAKDELSARIGLVVGNFLKRFSTILWGFTGVVAFAVFGNAVTDPDMLWGYATRQFLGPGLVGLMIACLLAASMSSADAFMISGSALFTKNLYQPLAPNRPDAHYITVGRIVSVCMVVGGILIALYFNNVLAILKYIWQLPVIFGAVFWLSIFWRKVTKAAALTTVVCSGIMIILLPGLLSQIKGISHNQDLLFSTKPSVIQVEAGATLEDVAAGRAQNVGELITKDHATEPTPVLFEEIVELDTPAGIQRYGAGLAQPNLLLLHALGINLKTWPKAVLAAVPFYMNALMPFILLIIVSLLTKPTDEKSLDTFFAKLHTPVSTDPVTDQREVALSIKEPHRFDQQKLFPGSAWEIMKPSRIVTYGFIICFGIALAVMGFAFVLANIKVP